MHHRKDSLIGLWNKGAFNFMWKSFLLFDEMLVSSSGNPETRVVVQNCLNSVEMGNRMGGESLNIEMRRKKRQGGVGIKAIKERVNCEGLEADHKRSLEAYLRCMIIPGVSRCVDRPLEITSQLFDRFPTWSSHKCTDETPDIAEGNNCKQGPEVVWYVGVWRPLRCKLRILHSRL